MSRAPESLRILAQRLIVYEAEEDRYAATAPVVFMVCEKLRPHLATLMGKAGYRALLARALAQASAEVIWLRAVHIKADGSLEGLNELVTQVDPKEFMEGRVVLLARLLGLLVAFIGEHLTLQMVQDVWPRLSLKGWRFEGDNDEK
jgi:hypothetical protein